MLALSERFPNGGGNQKDILRILMGGVLAVVLILSWMGYIRVPPEKETVGQDTNTQSTEIEMEQSYIDVTLVSEQKLEAILNEAHVDASTEHIKSLQAIKNGEMAIYEAHFSDATFYIIASSKAEALRAAQKINEDLSDLLTIIADQQTNAVDSSSLTVDSIDIESLRNRLAGMPQQPVLYKKGDNSVELRDINPDRAEALATIANAALQETASILSAESVKGQLYVVGSVHRGLGTLKATDIDLVLEAATTEDLLHAVELLSSEDARVRILGMVDDTLSKVEYAEAGTYLSITGIHFVITAADSYLFKLIELDFETGELLIFP